MDNETTIITKESVGPSKVDSAIFGVSVRAWLAVTLVSTVCVSHLVGAFGVVIEAVGTHDFSKVAEFVKVNEPLYSLVGMALGFYLGQNQKK
jgi:hypothetical protein